MSILYRLRWMIRKVFTSTRFSVDVVVTLFQYNGGMTTLPR